MVACPSVFVKIRLASKKPQACPGFLQLPWAVEPPPLSHLSLPSLSLALFSHLEGSARAGWLKLEQKEGVTEKKMPPRVCHNKCQAMLSFGHPGPLTLRLGLCLLLGLFPNL